MKSTHYDVTDRDGKSKHLLCVYDENAPCVCCEMPVDGASVSATALCATCDVGRDRSARCQVNKWRKPNTSKPNVWRNVTEQFLFDTREQCDAKMYELHLQGIQGFPHVIERMSGHTLTK